MGFLRTKERMTASSLVVIAMLVWNSFKSFRKELDIDVVKLLNEIGLEEGANHCHTNSLLSTVLPSMTEQGSHCSTLRA